MRGGAIRSRFQHGLGGGGKGGRGVRGGGEIQLLGLSVGRRFTETHDFVLLEPISGVLLGDLSCKVEASFGVVAEQIQRVSVSRKGNCLPEKKLTSTTIGEDSFVTTDNLMDADEGPREKLANSTFMDRMSEAKIRPSHSIVMSLGSKSIPWVELGFGILEELSQSRTSETGENVNHLSRVVLRQHSRVRIGQTSSITTDHLRSNRIWMGQLATSFVAESSHPIATFPIKLSLSSCVSLGCGVPHRSPLVVSQQARGGSVLVAERFWQSPSPP